MLKNIFKAAKDVLKSPIGGAIVGAAIPGLNKIPGVSKNFGGILDILESSGMARGLTSAGISALLGGNPQQAIASGLVASALGEGSILPEGAGTGIQDSISGFFKKPEAPEFEDFFKEETGLSVDDPKVTTEFIMAKSEDFRNKYENMESGFVKSLPYLAGGLGTYLQYKAMKDAQNNRPTYDMSDTSSNAFFNAAQGGGVQAFAQGNEVNFPRMVGDIKGPGDGQSDSIPAMLSNDEHVITRQEVATLGKMHGGDVDTGHDVLYAMRGGIKDLGDQMGVSYT